MTTMPQEIETDTTPEVATVVPQPTLPSLPTTTGTDPCEPWRNSHIVAFRDQFCKGPEECLKDTQLFITGFGEEFLSSDNPMLLARVCALRKIAQIIEKGEQEKK